MKRVCLLCFLCFCVSGAVCRANREWKPGYLVTHANDTLRGMIDYRGQGNDWADCIYKSSLETQEQKYFPQEIKWILYDSGLSFKSVKLKNQKVDGCFFVRSLVEGARSLSYLEMEITGDSTYACYVLENKETGKVITLNNRKQGAGTFSMYRKQMATALSVFFDHHPVMEKELERFSFSHSYLVNLFVKYNDVVCNDRSCVVYAEPERVPRRFFLSVYGGTQLTGTIDEDSPFFMVYGIGSAKLEPVVGLTASMSLDKHSDRILLNLGLGISPSTIRMKPEYASFDYRSLHIQNTLSVDIRWLNAKFRPFIGLGLYQQFVADLKNNLPEEITLSDRTTIDFTESIPKYNAGIILSAGVDIKTARKGSIPIRLTKYSNIAAATSANDLYRHSYLQLTIGYTFQLK